MIRRSQLPATTTLLHLFRATEPSRNLQPSRSIRSNPSLSDTVLGIPMSEKTKPAPSSTPIRKQRPTPIAFISGPQDVDSVYFDTHYAPSIKEAIQKGHNFTVGPSRGVDALALEYLRKSGLTPSRIRLYINTDEETKLRPIFRRFEESGGAVIVIKGGHAERDEAMTRGSHYDILRYRTEEECRAHYGQLYRKHISEAEKNELRRKSGIGLILPNVVPSSKAENSKA